jgi:hypothetical protein
MPTTILTVAPAAGTDLAGLVRIARSCGDIGASVIRVPPGDPAVAAALREATDLVVATDVPEVDRLDDLPGLTARHCTLVLGRPGGIPGTLQGLAAAIAALPPGATFSATGVGETAIPVMLAALAAGGHLRVGLEDTVQYAPGEPARNDAQLVARAAGLARIAQRPPAGPAEARTVLGIPA